MGSFMTPALCALVGARNVTVVDGDKLEAKNLNRQLFDPKDVGENKAKALSRRFGCNSVSDFYYMGAIPHSSVDVLMCCVDNDASRKEALASADMHGCAVIIAANEVHSSEAYFYKPDWQGTNRDPRIYYPELNQARGFDPRALSAGCTGEAQEKNVQLVTANFMAASLALHLYVVWIMESKKLDEEVANHLPHHMRQNLTKNEMVSEPWEEKA